MDLQISSLKEYFIVNRPCGDLLNIYLYMCSISFRKRRHDSGLIIKRYVRIYIISYILLFVSPVLGSRSAKTIFGCSLGVNGKDQSSPKTVV